MKDVMGTIGLVLAGAILPGCEGPAPTARTFSYMRLPGVSKAEAYEAAIEAMSERFRIARLDPAAGVITSLPEETTEAVPRRRLGDVVGLPRRLRQVATTHVTGNDTSSDVWCKVVIEQNETEEQYLFDQDRSMDDLPTATAAERGGATTAEQNTVWRVLRRDKQTERSVLKAIREVLDRKLLPAAP